MKTIKPWTLEMFLECCVATLHYCTCILHFRTFLNCTLQNNNVKWPNSVFLGYPGFCSMKQLSLHGILHVASAFCQVSQTIHCKSTVSCPRTQRNDPSQGYTKSCSEEKRKSIHIQMCSNYQTNIQYSPWISILQKTLHFWLAANEQYATKLNEQCTCITGFKYTYTSRQN